MLFDNTLGGLKKINNLQSEASSGVSRSEGEHSGEKGRIRIQVCCLLFICFTFISYRSVVKTSGISVNFVDTI